MIVICCNSFLRVAHTDETHHWRYLQCVQSGEKRTSVHAEYDLIFVKKTIFVFLVKKECLHKWATDWHKLAFIAEKIKLVHSVCVIL